MTSTDSAPLSAALGAHPRTASTPRQQDKRRYLPVDFAIPATQEAIARELLIAATGVLVHRYTGIERVEVDLVDREPIPRRLRVDLGDDASTTLDLIDALETVSATDPVICPCALSVADAGGDRADRELVVHLDPVSRRVVLGLDGGFDEPAADRIAGHFLNLLAQMSATPEAPVARLSTLTSREVDTVLDAWNATDALTTEDICLHQAFEARAAATPEAIAVRFAARSWTFHEVNDRANRLAVRLIELGAEPDARIGIELNKTPDLLISILGVLKAGAAYVPLDPQYPRERRERMIFGSSCEIMISSRELARTRPTRTGGVRHEMFVEDWPTLPAAPTGNPATGVRPDDLCYVIHTSGSTGSPKPIALRHRGVLNNLADLNARYAVRQGDSVLALSSPSFDMSVYEFLGVTIAGGTVVIPEPEAGSHPAAWADLVRRHHVTVWNTAPPLIELFLDFLEVAGDARPLPLRLCMTGGDWVPATMPARFREFAPGLTFVALGGATEASIHSTAFEWDEAAPWPGGHLPYGWPLANQRTYILDGRMRPVPVGVAGELHLGGIGLARGYLDRPAETSERFVRWSHADRPAERLYRTGDIARQRSDGCIEILGRKDFQVKINGIRVEVGEIEAVLVAHPGVRRAVVVSRATAHGGPVLVGYVTAAGRIPVDRAAVFDTVRARLPRHMVPASIEVVDSLPLNANGKVDRRALSAPESKSAGDPRSSPHESGPRGDWYRTVLDAWLAVLDRDHLYGHDDFFASGGDSMKAIRSMVRIDRRLRLSDIQKYPTATGLAEFLTKRFGDRPDLPS